MALSVFGPMPGRPPRLPSANLVRRVSTESTPPSVHRVRTRFGPRPGICRSAGTPAGIDASSSSRSATLPVVTNSRIFLALESPIPGISRRRAGSVRASSARSSPASSSVRATLRLALTLNALAPVRSKTSAISAKMRASSMFLLTGISSGAFAQCLGHVLQKCSIWKCIRPEFLKKP